MGVVAGFCGGFVGPVWGLLILVISRVGEPILNRFTWPPKPRSVVVMPVESVEIDLNFNDGKIRHIVSKSISIQEVNCHIDPFPGY